MKIFAETYKLGSSTFIIDEWNCPFLWLSHQYKNTNPFTPIKI